MRYFKLYRVFVCYMLAYAQCQALNSSATISSNTNIMTPNNIATLDNDTHNLLQLKRKLEIEKTQAEIDKIHGSSHVSLQHDKSTRVPLKLRFRVTGIALNQNIQKIAWLHSTENANIRVTIGSKIGAYHVNEITLQGVSLISNPQSGHRVSSIFLDRIDYGVPDSMDTSPANNIIQPPSRSMDNYANTSYDATVPPIMTVGQ